MLIVDLFKAIKAGNELKNPATLSNKIALTNVLVTLLSFGVGAARLFGVDVVLTDEQLIDIAGGVAVIMGVVNSIIHVATTKDAGL